MALPDNFIWEDLTAADVAICATATLGLVAYVGWRWRIMQAEREAKQAKLAAERQAKLEAEQVRLLPKHLWPK